MKAGSVVLYGRYNTKTKPPDRQSQIGRSVRKKPSSKKEGAR